VKHAEPAPEPAPEPGFSGLVAAAIALLFLAVRIAYLYARQPFFDELYTQWMAGEPLSSIVLHLLRDSGPPLYYFLARFPSLIALRWESLLFAAIAFVLVLRKFPLAAALLAVYPAAALYATEGRAYSLCAMFVAVGVLLFDEERPFAAMFAFVLAAYSHYYGVLFFPLLLVKEWRAFAAAVVLFVPGFILALHQPPEAMAWNVVHPLWILGASLAIGALPARTWRFAPAVLIPAALVVAFALAGRNVYFPERFESVLAAPLALWTAASLQRWRPSMRAAIVTLLMIAGVALIAIGIADERRQPPDPRLRAMRFAAGAPAVVASDYCYLVARTELGPRVRAFPPAQAEHPGWYRPPSQEAALAAARSLPASGFAFVGDAFTPELAAVRQVRRVQLRFRDGPVVVLWVAPRDLTSTVH